MKKLHSISDVAVHFGLDVDQVRRRCSTSVKPWPHIRPVQTKASTWLFTDEDIAAIEQRIRVRETTEDAWGRTRSRAS
jgi:hypothetical protein